MLQSQETGSVGHPLSQWLKDFIPQGKKVQVGLCAFLAVVAATLPQDCTVGEQDSLGLYLAPHAPEPGKLSKI